ncbi:MAG: putative dehydrogenase [Verrucomicrobiales bacterium]|jgi:predicted dehydrogenase
MARFYDAADRLDEAKKLCEELAALPSPVDASAPPVALVAVAPTSEWKSLHPTDGVYPQAGDPDFHQSFATASFDDASWQTGKDREGKSGGLGYGDEGFEGVDIGTPGVADSELPQSRQINSTFRSFSFRIRRMKRRQFLNTSYFAASAAALHLGSAGGKAVAEQKPKIKIGQIGVAHAHASGKMQIYRELEDEYEVVGIAEPDDALWAGVGNSKAYAGLKRLTAEELLNTPGLQAVAVETRVADLLRYAEMSVDAGMHVHLDKPAGTSLQDFKRILEKADVKQLTLQMGYMYRYNPAVLLLHEFIKRGWLGEIFEVHTVMSKVVPKGARAGLAEFEGGILFELGCHIIDLVVSVLGKPQKVTPHIRHGADGFADNMLAVFDYPKATATVKSTANEVEGFARRHLTVVGTGGAFHIQPLDRPKATIALDRDREDGENLKFRRGVQEVPFAPPYRRYLGDAIDFAKIIRSEKKSDYPSSHDLAVQETVLRACGMFNP